MTTRAQAGFSAVEGCIIVIVLVVVGGAGFMMVKRHAATSDPKPVVTSTTVPSAPEVKNTSDLTEAQQTLDSADVDAASTDNTQLEAQLNGF